MSAQIDEWRLLGFVFLYRKEEESCRNVEVVDG